MKTSKSLCKSDTRHALVQMLQTLQLTKIKSSNYHSIEEYCDQFEKVARDSSFDDEAKIYFFTLGLPFRIQERIRMIHPRIRRLSELITIVAGNVEIERRIFGTDPMEIEI